MVTKIFANVYANHASLRQDPMADRGDVVRNEAARVKAEFAS